MCGFAMKKVTCNQVTEIMCCFVQFCFVKTSKSTKLRVVYAVLHLIALEFTKHLARHTYATLQLSSGTDIYTVSKMLGHTNVKTTQIYAKVVDEKKNKAAQAIQLETIKNEKP